MNERMAAGAWGQFRGTGAHAVDRGRGNRAVALVAKRIHVRHVQQPRIFGTVRRVASHASLGFHRGMLVNKGPTCFGVALCADGVLIGSRLQVVVPKSSMNVVAVVQFTTPSFTLW